MRNSIKTGAFAAAMLFGSAVYSQSDSLGLPGDDLDLNAVLSIFKQSSSIEDFEKRLNAADTKINNLDLNNDNQVDYLRVVDYGKDDFHSIVIQDPVSKTETQDVAVIEVVKKDNETAHIQIVGDETLYGKNYIIEPLDQPQAKSSAKNKDSKGYDDDVYNTTDQGQQKASSHVMINVWGWPSVNYLYSPGYSYYVSPWYWGYYPGWYTPWRPYGGWYAYHSNFIGYNYGFYGYRRYHYAFPHAHNYYYGRRMSSGYVQKTAPNYGRRTSGGGDLNRSGGRTGQRTSNGNQRVNNGARSSNPNAADGGTRVRNNPGGGNRQQASPQQSGQQTSPRVRSGGNSNPSQGRGQMQNGGSSGQRVNSGGGGQRTGGGGGVRSGGGGGGGGARGGGGGGGARGGGR